ncbi:hypothetical protein F7725_025546 [Dissostichus mawsoni]|uniref:L1 transposable element RRM domain-containing protein n=1 Tax=Dissostichus mawsoni TaxID=36200 RepID=A0A7J5XBG0_DISMA|nr:hypothetical protein F7725_025546 [Dissostichus mawsoni]
MRSKKGTEKKTKAEKQSGEMQAQTEHSLPLTASAIQANNDEQPSWVSVLQTSLDAMQAKLENAQHNMDAKLDRIGSQMEEHLRGVREEMGQLREYMDKHGEDMKQGLDSFREETNRNFETAEAEMRAQKKDIEILEERWSTDVQDIITASLEQQTKLQDKLSDIEGRSRRNNVRIWGLKEGIEGDSVSEYINRLIHKELGMSEDIKLEIQRAHRALALNPQPDKFPRAIIVNFLRFEVKENVIKTAWRTVMEVEGRRVAAKRRKYVGLKRILKDKGIRFQSPMDTLRVYWNEGTMLYRSAQDAARAMRQRGWQVPDSREERPTLLQRLEAARKWTRLRRRERGDNNETRVREDRHRIGGADE